MTLHAAPTPTHAGLSVADLAALPPGSVVLDSGNAYNERCAWSKSDDTARETRTAWAAVQWAMDRTDEELYREFGPIQLLWSPATTTESAHTDDDVDAKIADALHNVAAHHDPASAVRALIADAWDIGFRHARRTYDMEFVGELADNPYRLPTADGTV